MTPETYAALLHNSHCFCEAPEKKTPHEGQGRDKEARLLAGALGPDCIRNSDFGWIAGRVALIQARN